MEVRVDEVALASAIKRLGWRIYSTNQPSEQLALEQAVLADRQEYQVERSLGRLQGRPLSLRPMYVQRDDQATGLIRLLSIALRVLTLWAFVVRRQLAVAGQRYRVFMPGIRTVMVEAQQSHRHLTALSPLHTRILELLSFSEQAYTRLGDVSLEPP